LRCIDMGMEIKDKVHYILSDLESVKDVFHRKFNKHLENVDYYAGRQWTEEEEELHRMQFRHPYVFNEIQHKVDHLIGMQTQTRLDVMAVGREKTDQQGADILTLLIKWANQINNVEKVETEVFLDAAIGGVGASVVYWAYNDMAYGFPKIEKVPINELYWDGDAKKQDLSDARWMARVMNVSRGTANELYPGYESTIKKVVGGTGSNAITGFIDQEKTKRQEDMALYGFPNENESRDIIQIIEYYEQYKKGVYVVLDDVIGDKYEFDDEKYAIKFANGLIKGYIEGDIDVYHEDSSLKIKVQCVEIPAIEQSVLASDILLFTQEIDIPFFPFDVNFAYHIDGDYWGFIDNLVSPQIAVNRFFSMWDYAVGASAKSPITVMESLLPRGKDIEDVRREMKNVSPVLPVLNHSAIDFKPNVPVRPELFQGIQFGINRMNDYAGGRNVLGFQENAAESGKAVMARAEQGGLARLPLFDNLRQWRRDLTYKMVWWIKNYMDKRQQLRIIGGDKDVQFMEIDDGVLDTIRELKYDIIVDEVARSESMRERKFEQLKQLFSVMPGMPPELITEFMLEYSDIPEAVKKELLNKLEHYKDYIAKKAQMQEEEKMQKSVMDSIKRKELKDAAERGEELSEKQAEVEKEQGKFEKQLKETEKMKEKLREENTQLAREKAINAANTKPELQRLIPNNIMSTFM